MYRNLVEWSSMSNNAEYVIFDEEMFTTEDLEKLEIQHRFFSHRPKLVVSREVKEAEIEAGLDVTYAGSLYSESTPKITQARDEFFKLKSNLSYKMEAGMSLQESLAQCLANSYYSCMSGGCGWYFLSALRWVIENEDVDLDHKICRAYPGKGPKYNTFWTFLDDIEEQGIPHLEKLISNLEYNLTLKE